MTKTKMLQRERWRPREAVIGRPGRKFVKKMIDEAVELFCEERLVVDVAGERREELVLRIQVKAPKRTKKATP